MKGKEKAFERDLELAMFTAWHTGRFASYSGEKLQSLDKVLTDLRRQLHGQPEPPRRQTNEEMIAAMRAISATRH